MTPDQCAWRMKIRPFGVNGGTGCKLQLLFAIMTVDHSLESQEPAWRNQHVTIQVAALCQSN
jgi:hypothetical protein